jgi:hypothetical protein
MVFILSLLLAEVQGSVKLLFSIHAKFKACRLYGKFFEMAEQAAECVQAQVSGTPLLLGRHQDISRKAPFRSLNLN